MSEIKMSDSTECHHSFLFVHTSASAFDSIRGMWSNLKTLSQHQPRKWNVTIVMKIPRSENSVGKKKSRETHSSSILFLKFVELGATCVLNMSGGPYVATDVVVCDHGIEDLLTGIGDLELRSSWKAQGQSFNLGEYIVSAGVLERGSMANTVVIEVCCTSELIPTAEVVKSVYSIIDSIVGEYSENIHVFATDINLPSSRQLQPENQSDQLEKFTLAHRCLQWVEMLQH